MRTRDRQNSKPFRLMFIALGVGLLVFLLANAHFAYVAFSSQPACVDHIKHMTNTPGTYRAAKSAC